LNCFAGAFCTVQVLSEPVFPGDGIVTVYTTTTCWLFVHILGTAREYPSYNGQLFDRVAFDLKMICVASYITK